jgi:hypothetical protein
MLFRFLLALFVSRALAFDNFVEGAPFRLHPNMGVAREHGARDVPGGAHYHLIAGALLVALASPVGRLRHRLPYLRQAVLPVIYTAFHEDKGRMMLSGTFLVRTAAANPLALVSLLRREVSRAQPEFRVTSIQAQQELIDAQTVRERLLAMLALFFAAVALLLAGVGVYGVLDYSVFRRRREIGIRMAIGAQAGDIARRVTFDIVGWIFAGSLVGLALGIASARYIESLLYQVKATYFSALAAPALALIAAAILAALPPVIRAVHVDPVSVLRSE